MDNVNSKATKTQRNIEVLQFGEGNFLRGFTDYMIDIANEKGVLNSSVVIAKPIEFGELSRFHNQDCVYTVLLRGLENNAAVEEKRIVTCIDSTVDCYGEYKSYIELAKLDTLKIVISNTTEAGIVFDATDSMELTPPKSYPGKLTQFLYERFKAFGGDKSKGLIMLPVELIEMNGKKLKECVLNLCQTWKLSDEFIAWVTEACIFCNTLVDRIITGYPFDEAEALWKKWGYEDNLIVTGESFALWVIESDKPDVVSKAFPLDKAGLPVIFTDNIIPYRERKVRILNGAHTGTVLGAFLAGLDTVGDCMNDADVRKYLEIMMNKEIASTVKLPADEVKQFADAVIDRFSNPFIKHMLLSISLNSVSKWKSRILPSLLDNYNQNGQLPTLLTFSFAALLAFYTSSKLEGDALIGSRGSETYKIMDDKTALEFFAANSALPAAEFVKNTASNTDFWGMDLAFLNGFCADVTKYLEDIRTNGARKAIQNIIA